jgi:hypothetical protein
MSKTTEEKPKKPSHESGKAFYESLPTSRTRWEKLSKAGRALFEHYAATAKK